MTEQRRQLADTEAVAVHYRVAIGTVRSWASRYGWKPYGGRRTRQWDLEEIEDWFTGRRKRMKIDPSDLAEVLRGLADAVERELPRAAEIDLHAKEPFELPAGEDMFRQYEGRPGLESAQISIRWAS